MEKDYERQERSESLKDSPEVDIMQIHSDIVAGRRNKG